MTIDEYQPPDDLALGKAQLILKTLRSAALKVPFGFDQEQAEEIWGAALGSLDLDVLTAAAGSWILTHEDFPSVAEFMTMANLQTRQVRDDERAHNVDVCDECDGTRWVTIRKMVPFYDSRRGETRQVEDRHARPCSRCLPERYELYVRGHFDKEHTDQGGCKYCWYYMQPWHHEKNPRNKFPLPH